MLEDDRGNNSIHGAGAAVVVQGAGGRRGGRKNALPRKLPSYDAAGDNDDYKMNLGMKQQKQQQQLQLQQPDDMYPTRRFLQEDETTPTDTTSAASTTTNTSNNNVVGRVSVLDGDSTTWTSPRQSSSSTTATATLNRNKDPLLEDKDDAERPFLDFDRQNESGDLVTTNLRPGGGGGGGGGSGLGGGLGGATAYFPDLVARVSYLVAHVEVPSSSGVLDGTAVSQSRQQPSSLTSTISSPFSSYRDGLIKAMDMLATKTAPEFFNENDSGVVVTKVTSGIMKVGQPTATANNDDDGDDESNTAGKSSLVDAFVKEHKRKKFVRLDSEGYCDCVCVCVCVCLVHPDGFSHPLSFLLFHWHTRQQQHVQTLSRMTMMFVNKSIHRLDCTYESFHQLQLLLLLLLQATPVVYQLTL